ncbi:hypothetical protein ACJRO7_010530 [Eucalyptus globulus]|uniref:peptidylprolyl isomerase n=1 Tax=Eucalyptus globulus TaxID=34317 RepID=A0ABD3LD45_EUCGL
MALFLVQEKKREENRDAAEEIKCSAIFKNHAFPSQMVDGPRLARTGIEVKPGKPYTQKPNGSRLRISQGTLGTGVATTKSTVQCNVGNATPVFICSLLPGKEESAQINLEFEEAQQVIFSVLGVRSVHLTGYYVRKGREFDDDSESYGEDIADTETDISEDDDKYEDSFINDGGVEFLPPSPMLNKSAEEEKPNHKKGRKGKDRRRRLRKKHEKSESDKVNSLPQQNSEGLLLESDEEDFFVSSLLKKKSYAKDSEINVPVVVIESPLDVVKKKGKQDGSTTMKSSEPLPPVVGIEPGSTAMKMKSKLRIVEGEMQNEAWQEDKEPKAEDPSKE